MLQFRHPFCMCVCVCVYVCITYRDHISICEFNIRGTTLDLTCNGISRKDEAFSSDIPSLCVNAIGQMQLLEICTV